MPNKIYMSIQDAEGVLSLLYQLEQEMDQDTAREQPPEPGFLDLSTWAQWSLEARSQMQTRDGGVDS